MAIYTPPGGDTGYADTEPGVGVWAFGPGVTTSAKTLSVTGAFTRFGVGLNTGVISYSLNGGSTWTTMVSTNATTASTTYTAAVPSGQNLANVLVMVQATPADATSSRRVTSCSWALGTMSIS